MNNFEMLNLTSFILVIGLVSFLWRLALKYNLVDRVLTKIQEKWPKLSPEVCVMCVTFWVTLVIFLIFDHNVSVFYNFLRAISATPFILELTRKEWE